MAKVIKTNNTKQYCLRKLKRTRGKVENQPHKQWVYELVSYLIELLREKILEVEIGDYGYRGITSQTSE